MKEELLMLKEKAGQYYFVQDKSCAEAILLAANEAYHLGMTEEATKLFAGFRTGMGMYLLFLNINNQ